MSGGTPDIAGETPALPSSNVPTCAGKPSMLPALLGKGERDRPGRCFWRLAESSSSTIVSGVVAQFEIGAVLLSVKRLSPAISLTMRTGNSIYLTSSVARHA